MTVYWTQRAIFARERLFEQLRLVNPYAADAQDDAIEALADTLDGIATYQRLSNGAHFVPIHRYALVLIYERDTRSGDAIILDIAPARSDWKSKR